MYVCACVRACVCARVCMCSPLGVIGYTYGLTHNDKQCGILTSLDSDEPVQPPVKLKN